MRKCRNWQTSKTKDLVIIAIVWVQVPSSALNNKTGIKQSVWSLSYCSKPKRALNPWFKVSPPARSARGMRSPGPHSVSAPLRSAQSRHPPDVLQPIFRKAPVVAGQALYNDRKGKIFMIRFNNDYNRGAFDCILKALADTNTTSYPGYGEDEWCDKAEQIIKGLIGRDDSMIKFIPGATQANYVVVAAALSSVQSVIAADTGHINCHEAASIENTGHKILALPNTDGKISAAQIEACAAEYYDNAKPEYLTEPKMVYISFPTEQGTLYTKRELCDISAVCKKYGMYLFVDGARMGYGLGSDKNDLTLCDFAMLSDVFYIGGTKCGTLFGEALVINAEDIKYRFKAYMKQNGAVLAKGWLMGLQFVTMLENGDYFEKTKRADELAMQIKAAFEQKKVPFWVESFTNQQFVILSDEQKKTLAEKYYFEEMGREKEGTVVRFCTSWATKQEEVDALVLDISKLV